MLLHSHSFYHENVSPVKTFCFALSLLYISQFLVMWFIGWPLVSINPLSDSNNALRNFSSMLQQYRGDEFMLQVAL